MATRICSLQLICTVFSYLIYFGCGNEHSSDRHLPNSYLRTAYRTQPCLGNSTCLESFCWGYEERCSKEQRFWVPKCSEPAQPWADSMEAKHEMFWNQADFGYVKDVVDTMQTICHPKKKGGSLLRCSENMRFCTAEKLFIDFRRFSEFASSSGRDRFLENVFKDGEVGGHCTVYSHILAAQGEHKSPLQSWFAELEKFTELDFNPTSKKHCDIIEKKPTVFMKLDAGVNLYHHFCDFYNLYASQHAANSFSDDIQIVMWDTSTVQYNELFPETWDAFSKHPMKRISDYSGKRVCFRNAVFPLLSRMRKGLYYNSYVVPGCEGSGMMMAFHQHLMQRLAVQQEPVDVTKLRITLLQRTTKFRQIVNVDELLNALKTVSWFDVRQVDYKYREYSFPDQIKRTYNSDIFIGMHGAGLAHAMFLPDWAALFEIYNTEDARCYHDLARQRGVVYATWEDKQKLVPESEGIHPTLGTPHAKFTNYSFDVNEFMRIVMRLADQVKQRKEQFWEREQQKTDAGRGLDPVAVHSEL